MIGLVPDIHVFDLQLPRDVDGRDEPGHDARILARGIFS
jgi:hypothetical protein